MSMLNNQFIFHPGNCINTKKTFASLCRQCIDMCPHGAINDIKKINSSKCTDCGVCMAVCPSDGFVDRAVDELKEYIFEAESVVLNCPAAQPEGYEINCIGMLDRDAWSTLMLLSAGKEVRILTGDCAACQDVKACAIGVGALNELLSQWTLPNNMKIEIVPWDGVTVQAAEANKPLSRSDKKKKAKLDDEKRDRKKLLEMGTKKLKSMIPGMLAEETYNVSRTRTWLLEALGRAPGHKIPFQALKINEKCTVCGFCARVCPQEALTHTKDDNAGTGAAEESASAAEIAKEAELAGANASADTTPTDRVPANRAAERFIYQAALCCHCQRCMKICGPQALTMVDMELDLRFLQGKILLHEMVPRFCVGCDRQIYHKLEPGLCIGCAKEDPELKGVLY